MSEQRHSDTHQLNGVIPDDSPHGKLYISTLNKAGPKIPAAEQLEGGDSFGSMVSSEISDNLNLVRT